MQRVKVGVIGCGNISNAYLTHMAEHELLDVAVCADLDVARARAKAVEHNVARACGVDELLADDDVQIVVNLTIPAAHAAVDLQIIEAGKHVWSEKPLAAEREDAMRVLDAAKAKGVRVGCAPDTFFGTGLQTARRAIDEGMIGKPVAATAFMMSRGHESWHPDPEFYYKAGGGPMLDMGPYYVTWLLQLLGAPSRVCGFSAIAIPQRTITSEPKHGQTIDVETPDHVTGSIEFEGGAIATVATSFAVRFSPLKFITVYGENGTLEVPNPNNFDNDVMIRCEGDDDWRTVECKHAEGLLRGAGVADMARAILTGRPHRADEQQAMTTLDVMLGFLDASRTGCAVTPQLRYERTAALPTGLKKLELD